MGENVLMSIARKGALSFIHSSRASVRYSPGMPLSVLIPAPVIATTFRQSLMNSASRCASAETLEELLLDLGVKASRMTRRAVVGRMISARSRRRSGSKQAEPSRGIPCVA